MRAFKYPRTPHLPFSEGKTAYDKCLSSDDVFKGKYVVVTEKYDGENTTLYKDTTHARSLDSSNHYSRNWVKNFWGSIKYKIPYDTRVCGENLYAVHSIKYENLPCYFLGFSFWRLDYCFDWDATICYFDTIGITPVNVLYSGLYDRKVIHDDWLKLKHISEGYVVRVVNAFRYTDFNKSVAKFVRKNHVISDGHWMRSPIERNGHINGIKVFST